MATYAKLLQNSNGDTILPYTRDSLVYHDNNYSLDNAIACWYDDPSTKVLARIRCSGSAAVTNMARDAYLPITASDFMVPSGWTFSKLLSSISAVSLADGEILTKCAAMTVGGAGFFFTNWSDSTNFPAAYGSGFVVSCFDTRERHILYMLNTGTMWNGKYWSETNSITWFKSGPSCSLSGTTLTMSY